MKTNLWNHGFGKLATRSAQTMLILFLTALVVLAIVHLHVVFVPVIIATILACAMSPLVRFLQTKCKMPRTLATGVSFLAIAGVLTGAGFFIYHSVASQWSHLVKTITDGAKQVTDWLHSGNLPISAQAVNEAMKAVEDYFASSAFAKGAVAGASSVAEVLVSIILTLVILFYLLKDGEKIWRFLVSFLSTPLLQRKAMLVGDRSVKVFGSYIRGTTIVALMDATFICIGLLILRVPLAIPLAVLVFLGAYIPIIGATLAGTVAALVTLVTNDLPTALIVVAIVVGVNQLEGHLIAPFVLGNALKLHSLIILLAIAVGTTLGGVIGALLAAPITAVLWVAWKTWHEPEPVLETHTETTDDTPEVEDSVPVQA
jgi:predicted PurR-regulated permease PerM